MFDCPASYVDCEPEAVLYIAQVLWTILIVNIGCLCVTSCHPITVLESGLTMSDAYFKVESNVDGIRGRKLFTGDDVVYASMPAFEPIEPGAVVKLTTIDGLPDVTTEVLANAETARARVWGILDDFDVDPTYSAQVHNEVTALLSKPGLDDLALTDMRALAFITIDNEDSRDLDQAMYIERSEQGFDVYYALADAAFYVASGSVLFADALHRGSSYYLPDMSVPMLPSPLSEGLISLNPQVDRRALVFVIKLDEKGGVLNAEIQRARIMSRAKLSYDGVQAYHDDKKSSDLTDKDYTDTLDLLKIVGDLRITLARLRNVVEYDRVGLSVEYVNNGEKFVITEDARNNVESWNEQISLLCNHEGAKLLLEAQSQRDIQPIFRVHTAPDAERLKKFSRILNALVNDHKLDGAIWKWRWRDSDLGSQETIAEYLRRLPDDGVSLPLRRAIEHQARMLNNASVFSAEPGPHHSLKLSGYARFSSPMREVAGIFTHQEIIDFCTCGEQATPASDDELLREKVIEAANTSRQRQKKISKAVYKLAIDDLLTEDLKHPLEQRPLRGATIFGVRPTRLYVRLDSPPVDVKIYSKDLETEFGVALTMNRQGTHLRGSAEVIFNVGDKLQVRAKSYNEQRDRWLLLPIKS